MNYSHEDLLALYVTAGTFSSFGANVYNTIRKPIHMGMPGLGASGALLACAAILSQDDNIAFSIIFLPMISMSGKQVVALISAANVIEANFQKTSLEEIFRTITSINNLK